MRLVNSVLIVIGVIVACLVLLSGCGDSEEVYTWGDACEQISRDYCATAEHCWGADIPGCELHNEFHCCVLTNSCEYAESQETRDNVDACSAALAEYLDAEKRENQCGAFLWGIMPEECYPHLEDWARDRKEGE